MRVGDVLVGNEQVRQVARRSWTPACRPAALAPADSATLKFASAPGHSDGKRPAGATANTASNTSGPVIDARRLVGMVVAMMVARLAGERHVPQPEHVERRQRRAEHGHDEQAATRIRRSSCGANG